MLHEKPVYCPGKQAFVHLQKITGVVVTNPDKTRFSLNFELAGGFFVFLTEFLGGSVWFFLQKNACLVVR